MAQCFNITPLQLSDTFNTWFTRTNTIITTLNDIEIQSLSVYDHPTNNYFGQIIRSETCALTSEIVTGPFINFINGNTSIYGAGTSANPRKITLTFPNDSSFLADRQLTGNDELIINDGSVAGGIPVKKIKAKDIVPSTIDVSYLRIQNRNSQAQGSTFAFYSDSEWSGISASNFSAERLQGYVPATAGINGERVIPLTDNVTGLIPDSFVRLPVSFKLDNVLVPGFDATADVKTFDLSAGRGISLTASVGNSNPGTNNAISYTIEALIPATGNNSPYGMNLFNINGYWNAGGSLSADGRSLLSAHSGLSGGKGIKTNLTTRNVALPVRYIIPGEGGNPDTTITYTGMTAVDIFTIAENPDDSNYVRRIGDVMTGTLTGTEASFTSLTASNGFIGTLTGVSSSFTSLTASNGFIGTLTGVSSSFTSLTASNGFIGSLTTTNYTTTNGFIGTLTGNEASFTSLTATNGFIGTLTGNDIKYNNAEFGTESLVIQGSSATFTDTSVVITGDSTFDINDLSIGTTFDAGNGQNPNIYRIFAQDGVALGGNNLSKNNWLGNNVFLSPHEDHVVLIGLPLSRDASNYEKLTVTGGIITKRIFATGSLYPGLTSLSNGSGFGSLSYALAAGVTTVSGYETPLFAVQDRQDGGWVNAPKIRRVWPSGEANSTARLDSNFVDDEYVTKRFVDAAIAANQVTADLVITSGRGQVSNYSNIISNVNHSFNNFTVLPPVGYTMDNLVTFMCVNATVYFAGRVDANDIFYNYWKKDTIVSTLTTVSAPTQPSNDVVAQNPQCIRCWVGNTEVNNYTKYYWFAIWSTNANSSGLNSLPNFSLFS